MELSRKYRKMLDRIKDESEQNRKHAEQRFLHVIAFLSDFEKTAIKQMGEKFTQRKAILEFSRVNDLYPGTFTRWLQAYQAKGIQGLVPSYGNRKGSSPYTIEILPIITEIIKPGDGVGSVYKKLVPICQQLSVKIPSQKTVGRMLDTCGLISRRGGRGNIVTLKLSLDVDTQRPLACLQQLSDFIGNNDVFSPEVKDTSLRQINGFLCLISRLKPLSLFPPPTPDEIKELSKYKAGLHKNRSAKAAAILMINQNQALAEIVRLTGRTQGTILRWVKQFNDKRVGFVEVKLHHPEREKRLEERRARIIDIIHTPPGECNVNRGAWNYGSVASVYFEKYGEKISKKTVERAVNKSGYTWRHARKVLTSPDPDYKAKIAKVLEALRGMKTGEAFFFMDEAGPYRVRKYGGKALAAEGEVRTLPERQKSKGKVQFIAALEAVTNQVSWRFIESKGTDSIIAMIEDLRQSYANCKKLILTWDAISSHSSSLLMLRVAQWNESADQGDGPYIEIVPLPSRSQFLNVIESVLGGTKRAVIYNSNYATPRAMQEAIAGHFEERNQYYRDNPKRAGNKIWDKQAFDIDKLAGGLFKKM